MGGEQILRKLQQPLSQHSQHMLLAFGEQRFERAFLFVRVARQRAAPAAKLGAVVGAEGERHQLLRLVLRRRKQRVQQSVE